MLSKFIQKIADAGEIDKLSIDVAADAGLDDLGRRILKDYVATRMKDLRDLAQALGDPEDDGELYRTLATYWLELRFEWQRYNDVMNYQMLKGLPVDSQIVAIACISSAILDRMENLLEDAHRTELAEYAQKLLETAGERVLNLKAATV